MSDLLYTQAEIADLSRRVEVLEALYLGKVQEPPQISRLVSLYWDACRAHKLEETGARHWARQLFALDARTLLLIARAVRDPMPWHPFLVLTKRYRLAGFDLHEASQHVLSAARELLRIQGFDKVQPEDATNTPLRIHSAIASISSMEAGHDIQRVIDQEAEGTGSRT